MSNFPERVHNRIERIRERDSESEESDQSAQYEESDQMDPPPIEEHNDDNSSSASADETEDDTRFLWIIGTAVAAILIWVLITYMPMPITAA